MAALPLRKRILAELQLAEFKKQKNGTSTSANSVYKSENGASWLLMFKESSAHLSKTAANGRELRKPEVFKEEGEKPSPSGIPATRSGVRRKSAKKTAPTGKKSPAPIKTEPHENSSDRGINNTVELQPKTSKSHSPTLLESEARSKRKRKSCPPKVTFPVIGCCKPLAA